MSEGPNERDDLIADGLGRSQEAASPSDGDGVVAPTSGEAADLLPCPFCGGDAALVQWRDTADPNATWVECRACEAMVETVHDGDASAARSRAAARWNRRAIGVGTDRTLTRDELRDVAMRHGHFIIPARAGIVFTWTDKNTGEVLGRGELARGNVTPLKPTPSSGRLSSDRAREGKTTAEASPELVALGEAAEYWVRENDLKQNTISADIKLFDAARTYAASVKG